MVSTQFAMMMIMMSYSVGMKIMMMMMMMTMIMMMMTMMMMMVFCHPTQRLHFAHGAKHAVMALSQHSTMHVITFMRWALIPRPRSHVRALCPPVLEFLWTQGGGPQQASKHPLHNGLAECVANHVSDLPV